MAEGEMPQHARVELKGPLPSGPPTFVQFVLVDHVGDEVQLTLCDVNTTTLRMEIEKAAEAKTAITLPVEPFQRLMLSKLAVLSLADVLGQIAAKFAGEEAK